MSENPPLYVPDGGDIPSPLVHLIRVVYPKARSSMRAVILCRRALPILTHWDGQRTQPHKEPAAQCDGCVMGWAKRWRAYASAYRPVSGAYCLLDLTPSAVRSCAWLDPKSGVDLRGRPIELFRCGDYNHAPLRAEVGAQPDDMTRVPPDFPIARALERMWGLAPGTIKAQQQQ